MPYDHAIEARYRGTRANVQKGKVCLLCTAGSYTAVGLTGPRLYASKYTLPTHSIKSTVALSYMCMYTYKEDLDLLETGNFIVNEVHDTRAEHKAGKDGEHTSSACSEERV